MDQPPAEALAPYIPDTNIVKDLLRESYGLTVTNLKSLNGYDDKNFHITVAEDHCNPNIGQIEEQGYFLKVINSIDSKRPEMYLAMKSAMDHCIQHDIPTQKTLANIKGEFLTELTVQKEGEILNYKVCLRNFLPGRMLDGVQLTPGLLFQLGEFTAKIAVAFQSFSHTFYDDFDCLWSLNSIPKIKGVTAAVKDDSNRALAEDVLREYDNQVIPRKKDLPKGQIHGDINEQNILVTKSEIPEICGILDFQDTAYSYPVYDLALILSYTMMMPAVEVDTLDVPGHVLAGYTKVRKLQSVESEMLKVLAASRMVQSLVYGAYTHQLDPSNTYVLSTSRWGWEALHKFWNTSNTELQQKWDKIIETYTA